MLISTSISLSIHWLMNQRRIGLVKRLKALCDYSVMKTKYISASRKFLRTTIFEKIKIKVETSIDFYSITLADFFTKLKPLM